MRRDYGFALQPKWLIGHAIAVIAIVVFISMGFWQLRRLDERQDFNARLLSRTTAGEVTLDEALTEFGPDQDELELRVVVAEGTYRPAEEVILLARSLNGFSGHHVLTPLYLDEGRAVLVDRGWVPIDLDEPGMNESAPAQLDATVYGVLRKTETRGSFGPTIPAEGVVNQVPRVDVERLDAQVDGDLEMVYIQLLKQDPASATRYPTLVRLPEPSEGPHLGYAVQWFLFAAVTAVGYPILLRRTSETSQKQSS